VLALIFSLFLAFLILGGAVFIAKGGMDLCEDSVMVKALVGGFLGLYVVAAVALKLSLPSLPSDQVDMRSLVPPSISQALSDTNFRFPWSVDTVFGAE
jgi:hypothetical protein